MTIANWIAAADVAVGALTAIAVLYLGHLLSLRVKQLEATMAITEIVVKERIEVYESAAVPLNEIFCYMTYIGKWREFTPEDVIARKRQLDALFHANRPILGDRVLDTYEAFMATAFATGQGRGTAARLRSDLRRHEEEYAGEFRPEWKAYFVEPEERSSRDDLRATYDGLLAAVRDAVTRSSEKAGG